MAKDAPGMRGNRSRNQTGRLRDTRDDKHVDTLERQYGRNFDVRGDMHVGTLLDRLGYDSVHDLVQSDEGK
jgi:predicted deacylase